MENNFEERTRRAVERLSYDNSGSTTPVQDTRSMTTLKEYGAELQMNMITMQGMIDRLNDFLFGMANAEAHKDEPIDCFTRDLENTLFISKKNLDRMHDILTKIGAN